MDVHAYGLWMKKMQWMLPYGVTNVWNVYVEAGNYVIIEILATLYWTRFVHDYYDKNIKRS